LASDIIALILSSQKRWNNSSILNKYRENDGSSRANKSSFYSD
jgi:hypothetical protein